MVLIECAVYDVLNVQWSATMVNATTNSKTLCVCVCGLAASVLVDSNEKSIVGDWRQTRTIEVFSGRNIMTLSHSAHRPNNGSMGRLIQFCILLLFICI